jgi:hypothetical protein
MIGLINSQASNSTDKPLIFTNVTATFTTNSDIAYSDYDYKAVLTCLGVTASMLATVIFSEEQATSGNYALTCESGINSVTIYSNDDTSITIPTIIAGTPIEVEVSGGAMRNYSTEEQIVGTWIDGKPLYEKMIATSGDVMSSTAEWVLNDIDVSDIPIDTLVDFWWQTTTGACHPNFFNYNGTNIDVYYEKQPWHLSKKYNVVQYTKTTDTVGGDN